MIRPTLAASLGILHGTSIEEFLAAILFNHTTAGRARLSRFCAASSPFSYPGRSQSCPIPSAEPCPPHPKRRSAADLTIPPKRVCNNPEQLACQRCASTHFSSSQHLRCTRSWPSNSLQPLLSMRVRLPRPSCRNTSDKRLRLRASADLRPLRSPPRLGLMFISRRRMAQGCSQGSHL